MKSWNMKTGKNKTEKKDFLNHKEKFCVLDIQVWI